MINSAKEFYHIELHAEFSLSTDETRKRVKSIDVELYTVEWWVLNLLIWIMCSGRNAIAADARRAHRAFAADIYDIFKNMMIEEITIRCLLNIIAYSASAQGQSFCQEAFKDSTTYFTIEMPLPEHFSSIISLMISLHSTGIFFIINSIFKTCTRQARHTQNAFSGFSRIPSQRIWCAPFEVYSSLVLMSGLPSASMV